MTNIYILQLSSQKWYVGKTEQVAARVQEHFNGEGSEWTRRHPPVRLVISYPNCDSFDEDKYTKQYMSKYGIDNVRGGSYCKMQLSSSEREAINRELAGATDKCLNCGEAGHFAADCQRQRLVNQRRPATSYQRKSATKREINHNNNRCFRCGRAGHYADSCYASTTSTGLRLENTKRRRVFINPDGSYDSCLWTCKICDKKNIHERKNCQCCGRLRGRELKQPSYHIQDNLRHQLEQEGFLYGTREYTAEYRYRKLT